MNRICISAALGALLSTAAGSCSGAAQRKPPVPEKVTEKLEPYQCGTIERLHTLGGVFLASQPKSEDFEKAKDGGVKTVVDLRKRDEDRKFDEEKTLKDLGIEYINVPFGGPAELTDEVFDSVRKLLNDSSKRPLLLHCASANRVGAVWLAHRVLDGGLDYDAAAAEARTVGLKAPPLEDKAKDYIQRHRK